MKKISIVSVALSVLGLALAFYLFFSIAPQADALEESSFSMLDRGFSLDSPEFQSMRSLAQEKSALKNNLVNMVFVASGIGLLSGLFAGIKKVKLGWVAVALSVVGILLALISGTHAFS